MTRTGLAAAGGGDVHAACHLVRKVRPASVPPPQVGHLYAVREHGQLRGDAIRLLDCSRQMLRLRSRRQLAPCLPFASAPAHRTTTQTTAQTEDTRTVTSWRETHTPSPRSAGRCRPASRSTTVATGASLPCPRQRGVRGRHTSIQSGSTPSTCCRQPRQCNGERSAVQTAPCSWSDHCLQTDRVLKSKPCARALQSCASSALRVCHAVVQVSGISSTQERRRPADAAWQMVLCRSREPVQLVIRTWFRV